MSVLRRLFGGSGADRAANPKVDPKANPAGDPPASAAEIADDERAYERELLREDADRLSSDLIQRQMRYADRAWTPPAQGGEQRATLEGGGERSG